MRTLKIAVVVMGIMLVVGFVALIAVIAGRVANKQKAIEAGGATTVPFAAAPIDLPAGARIETLAVGPDRIVVDLMLAGGERQLVVIDLASGRKLGTVPLRSAP